MKKCDSRYTGTKIGEVLDQQGKRQDWLAAHVGVRPATVNRWIRGSRTLDHTSAELVATALGVPFSLLFELPIGNTGFPSGYDSQEAA